MKREAHTPYPTPNNPNNPMYTLENPFDVAGCELGQAALTAAAIKTIDTPSVADMRPRVLIDEQGDLREDPNLFTEEMLNTHSPKEREERINATARDRVNRYIALIGGFEAVDFSTIRQEVIHLFGAMVGPGPVIHAVNQYIEENSDRIAAQDTQESREPLAKQGSPEDPQEVAEGRLPDTYFVLTDDVIKKHRQELLAEIEKDAAIIREADSYIPPKMRPDQFPALVVGRPPNEVVWVLRGLGLF